MTGDSRLKSILFHPLSVLLFSLAGAALFALYAALRFVGDRPYLYYYVIPIVVPFVAFLFDRAERFRQTTLTQSALDLLVVGISMWRAVGHVPFISGHALFLTYALLSTRSRVAQLTSGLVMLEVIYLKYIFWHDWVTPTSGIILGTLAALVVWRLRTADVEMMPPTTT